MFQSECFTLQFGNRKSIWPKEFELQSKIVELDSQVRCRH
jgi:hypothetical protein